MPKSVRSSLPIRNERTNGSNDLDGPNAETNTQKSWKPRTVLSLSGLRVSCFMSWQNSSSRISTLPTPSWIIQRISSRMTVFSSLASFASPGRIVDRRDSTEAAGMCCGLASVTCRSRSPMTCWMTLNVVTASCTDVLESTRSGDVMGARCHSIICSSDMRWRSTPERRLAK